MLTCPFFLETFAVQGNDGLCRGPVHICNRPYISCRLILKRGKKKSEGPGVRKQLIFLSSIHVFFPADLCLYPCISICLYSCITIFLPPTSLLLSLVSVPSDLSLSVYLPHSYVFPSFSFPLIIKPVNMSQREVFPPFYFSNISL